MSHTLNGIYLVRENRTINTKIGVIFCDFQPLIVELALQLKSLEIFFIITGKWGPPLRSSGVFTVPKADVYILIYLVKVLE